MFRAYRLPILFFLLALGSGGLVLRFVDLQPKIDRNFFFADDDPQLYASAEIEKLFSYSPQVIFTAAGNIKDRPYLRSLALLTDELKGVKGIDGVMSLGAGPSSVEGAIKSPLWSRLLVADDLASSNIIVTLKGEGDAQKATIQVLKKLKEKYHKPHFQLALSGVPFVVSEIQDRLIDEIKFFSAIAFGLFSILILVLYRSIWIFFGSVVSCMGACFISFLLLHIFKIEAGILMANLWSIVFVLTLSHIVFITGNWEILSKEKKGKELINAALHETGPASLWAMVTTLLGFLTLLLVAAKPLRHFGMAGAVGALVAIGCAYWIYPAYLSVVTPHADYNTPFARWAKRFVVKRHHWAWMAAVLLAVLCFPGLKHLDTDPPLFSYFERSSALRDDLVKIDKQGGSSPLEIVVRDKGGARFNNTPSYMRLWELQYDIEENPAVGAVLSLPLLMGEAVLHPIAKYFPWELRLRTMESKLFGGVGKNFITKDRTLTRYMIRMKESEREGDRAKVIAELKETVEKRGFEPTLIGGLYQLQMKLSNLLAESIYQGIGGLLVLFLVIAAFVSRSAYITAVMIACLAVIPITLFGLTGHARYALDMVAAPGANIAIAIGIDDMIHLTYRARTVGGKRGWEDAAQTLWKPVVGSTLMVVAGFATFGLSRFPPTQRLGMLAAIGTVMAIVMSLLVLPTLARMREKRSS